VRPTHSTPGEDTVAILDSILLYPSSHLPLFFLISTFSSFIICFFMKLVALLYQICYFCYHHRFYFQMDSTAPFHNMVLVIIQLFLCLYSSFFLNRHLLFYDTVYCLSFPVWISVYNFSQNWHTDRETKKNIYKWEQKFSNEHCTQLSNVDIFFSKSNFAKLVKF